MLAPRTGMVKNTSVRARSDSADALRGFPFKGVGDSREKVRFRLVKDKGEPIGSEKCERLYASVFLWFAAPSPRTGHPCERLYASVFLWCTAPSPRTGHNVSIRRPAKKHRNFPVLFNNQSCPTNNRR